MKGPKGPAYAKVTGRQITVIEHLYFEFIHTILQNLQIFKLF